MFTYSAIYISWEKIKHVILTQGNAIYHVVPMADAPSETTAFGVGRTRLSRERGYGVQVVPLSHVSASEITKLLGPVVSEANILRTDPARNLVVLGGTRQELDALLDIVHIFDVDWLAGMSFGFFPLQFADAKTIADELRQIVLEGEEAPLSGLLRFVPVERLNALMVISTQADYIDRVRIWIERLDRTSETEEARLFVYYVQNKRAVDLADTLNQIFSGTAGTAVSKPSDKLRPGLKSAELRSEERETTGTSKEKDTSGRRTTTDRSRQGKKSSRSYSRAGTAGKSTPK